MCNECCHDYNEVTLTVFSTHTLISGGRPQYQHWPSGIDFRFLELFVPFSLTQDIAPINESHDVIYSDTVDCVVGKTNEAEEDYLMRLA